MIDTHCHLYYPDFEPDLPAVIARAQAAGVIKIITIAVDRTTAQACLDIAARFPGVVYPAVGVHPQEADHISEADVLWIEAAAGDPLVVAIGEIGLDFYRGETNHAQQEKLFERMLHLARATGLPAIVHHRSAGLRTWEIVRDSGLTRGVFHCFSEDIDYAKRVLDLGFYVSFTGNLTYKNSRGPDVARALPLDRILLETDAPFMAPVPFRGKRCEPTHVRQVMEKLAEVHNIENNEVDNLTTKSAIGLFFAQ
jgi:TatD DNase family protein